MHTDYSHDTWEGFEQGSVLPSPTDILTVNCLMITLWFRTLEHHLFSSYWKVSSWADSILILILMLLINLLLLWSMWKIPEKCNVRNRRWCSQVGSKSLNRTSHSMGEIQVLEMWAACIYTGLEKWLYLSHSFLNRSYIVRSKQNILYIKF